MQKIGINELFNQLTVTNVLNKKVIKSMEMFAESASDIEPHRPPKKQFRDLIGKSGEPMEAIGPHPDFTYLDYNQSENHYIVSVFVDIKGSTVLATKLPLDEVRFIKNGILVSAIDIFQAFDGHIHRLQGDAIFAFFGGKSVDKSDAIVDALNASTFLQMYVKESLSKIFEEQGFPAIRIRIGIDFGDDNKVLWTRYGIQNCDEITTTSVHTDLAAKLQSKAPGNGIMVGENIVKYLDLPDEFKKVKTFQRNNEILEDLYVIDNSFLRYPMWVFDWKKYYSRFSFLDRTDIRYQYASPRDFIIKCVWATSDESVSWTEYKSNCGSIPKNVILKFYLELQIHVDYDEIIWEVENRGAEAEEAEQLNFRMDEFDNKVFCYQGTAFKGHHYMKCTILKNGLIIGQDRFGIYVR